MRLAVFLAASALFASWLPGQAPPAPSGGTAPDNPFFQEWKTPFGVPPFTQIKEQHFLPAYKEAIARQRREVDEIAQNPAAPTFANTIEAMDRSGEFLSKVGSVFSNLTSAETNDQLQAINREVAPLLSALRDDIRLNAALFSRIKTIWDQRDNLKLLPVQMRLLDDTYKSFVRGGANLNPEQKERLRKINSELSVTGLKFGDNLLKETNGYKLVIEKQEDLAGLPAGIVA